MSIPTNLIWKEVTVRGISCYVADPSGGKVGNEAKPVQLQPKELDESVESLIDRHYRVGKKRRLEAFEKEILPMLLYKHEVFTHASAYCLVDDNWGQVDYYPKGGKLLIRKENEWIDLGLYWMFSNLDI